jgi:hypothetical protein
MGRNVSVNGSCLNSYLQTGRVLRLARIGDSNEEETDNGALDRTKRSGALFPFAAMIEVDSIDEGTKP